VENITVKVKVVVDLSAVHMEPVDQSVINLKVSIALVVNF
jgi:hypothetical protein